MKIVDELVTTRRDAMKGGLGAVSLAVIGRGAAVPAAAAAGSGTGSTGALSMSAGTGSGTSEGGPSSPCASAGG